MSHQFLLKTPIQLDIGNPTPQQTLAVIQAIVEAGTDVIRNHDDFLILEKIGPHFKGVHSGYMQARPHRGHGYAGMFLVEYRDGEKARQYKSYCEAGAPLAALFQSYLNEDEAWREMVVWRDISFQFEDLRATLPPEEFAASFFSEGEWDNSLKAKEQRDRMFWRQLGEDDTKAIEGN